LTAAPVSAQSRSTCTCSALRCAIFSRSGSLKVAQSPERLKMALGRARRASLEGKPYLIDGQVARMSVA